MAKTKAAQTVKHLTRIQATEFGGVTRYTAYCGASGTTSRDYFPNLTRGGEQIVTCTACMVALAGIHFSKTKGESK